MSYSQMQDSSLFQTVYKLRLKDDSSEFGLLNWSPLRQLNAWASPTETFTVRAMIMAFGWRPFVFSGPRAHFFSSLKEAQEAVVQLVSEASLLKRYAVTPHQSLSDVYMSLAKGDYQIDLEVEAEIYGQIEISDILVSQHDLLMASVQDSKADMLWYVVHLDASEGHIFLSADMGYDQRSSWVPEDKRGSAWSSTDEVEALAMAKRVTRREEYYAYPLRVPAPERS